jgi:hypothetical protein
MSFWNRSETKMNNPAASSGELNPLIRDQFHQRFKRSSACFTLALRAWYNSSCKLQRTLHLKFGSHYQRVSLIKMKFNAAIISEIDEN